MMEKSDIHWTDEEELLSKFVLHQLSPDESEKLAAHLNTCDQCRQVVREETLLIAGVKSAGRSEMRGRLSRRLATTGTRPFQIPWTRVASLAAMIVILVAVGVYNDWFSTNFPTTSSPPEQIAQEKIKPPVESADKRKEQPAPMIADAMKPAQTTGTIERDRLDRLKDKEQERREQANKKDEMYNYQLMTKSAEAPRANEGGGIADEALRLESGSEAAGQVVASPSQTFWLEGHVTSTKAGQGQDLSEAPSARQKIQTLARPQVQTNSMKDSKASSTSEMQSTPLQVSIDQKPSSLLPRALQTKQNGTIQTLVENRNNNLQMTLYFDSLLPDSELQSARVESLNGDSIILNLPNQRIGYRLPPALQGQVNMKAIEVK